jgi:hypothetical protein
MIDDRLARLERLALILTAVLIGIALLVPRGGIRMALGVAGGALLSGISYWAIKRGVGSLADVVLARGTGRRSPRGFLAFVFRYALLAGMAYVMIARLRLHPIGLLGGASVIPLAAVIEAIRQTRPIRK